MRLHTGIFSKHSKETTCTFAQSSRIMGLTECRVQHLPRQFGHEQSTCITTGGEKVLKDLQQQVKMGEGSNGKLVGTAATIGAGNRSNTLHFRFAKLDDLFRAQESRRKHCLHLPHTGVSLTPASFPDPLR